MSVLGVKRESRDQFKWKHSVFGYIRRHEVDGSVYVPEVIKSLCVDFYCLDEKFVRASHSSTLRLDEGGRLVYSRGPDSDPSLGYSKEGVTGSVWIDANSQEICKCKWALQITGGNDLIIGIRNDKLYDYVTHEPRSFFHKIAIRHGRITTERSSSIVEVWQSKTLGHGLASLDEVTMELDVEKDTLSFNIHGTPRYKHFIDKIRGTTTHFTTRVEWRNVPKAKYHLYARIGRGHSLRLAEFSVEHRTCSQIPIIPRDVPFSCTHWIIHLSLIVLWVAIDYKLNRYFHEIGYLRPKIILTAALAFVLGIRFGLNH